jgi:hypothetical membrane protein
MKYIGLINLVFIFTIVAILIKKSKEFDFTKFTFSDLGEWKGLGFWFNLSLIIFSVNQVLFALQVSKSEIANFLFILGGGIFRFRGNIYNQKTFPSSYFCRVSVCYFCSHGSNYCFQKSF